MAAEPSVLRADREALFAIVNRLGDQLGTAADHITAAVDLLARHLQVIDWSREAAEHHADIRADLKKKGQLIGSNDLLIAAHARSLAATVVTNNVKDFGRVKGLRIENWMD